jgi:hypothetical protein
MYVSTRHGRSWSQPRNAGPIVNTADDDDSGDVTPDGRFVIFARSKPGAQFWSMYWSAAQAVDPELSHNGCH